MYIYHTVLEKEELENVKRWAEEENRSVEECIQGMVDEQMELRLELERGKYEK